MSYIITLNFSSVHLVLGQNSLAVPEIAENESGLITSDPPEATIAQVNSAEPNQTSIEKETL